MSGNEPTSAPFSEFLDDYFAECDEHLTVARRNALALEPFVGQPHLDRSLLEELFRSFHSVKGLSAMVGVREAEQLAHQMESYLSALRKEHLLLTAEGLDTLINGVKTLDQVITARRNQMAAPELGPLLLKFATLVAGGLLTGDAPLAVSRGKVVELAADKQALLEAAVQSGARAWRFTFVPAADRAERGVNVNTVRKRLQDLGELVHSAPLVTAGGQVAFAFIVVTRAEEDSFVPWREDGLSWEPYATAPEDVPPRESPEAKLRSVGIASSITPSNFVRVDLTRLDELMRMVGELVISRARLEENVKRAEAALPAAEWRLLQETNLAIERQLRDLREGVMRVRLVPIREVFARMQFVVRDLTRESGKKVRLVLSGQETEIDKFVVERMMDPLLHLVRNAVSHGLETPEEREASGKSLEGTLSLRATTTGETIEVEVEDDGRGMDTAAVLARGRASGLLSAQQTTADIGAVLDVICAPGFSTRDEADRASGRGVGMAVVRSAVEELGGSLALDTRPGKGTRFTIHLPLTLAIADALIVSVEGQTFAIPQVSVREVLQVEPRMATGFENNEIIPYRDGVLPLVRLARFFGLVEQPGRTFYALVVGTGLAAVGLAADRVLGLREIVVRPLTDALVRAPGISGATELGDGRVVLILDTMTLARAARRPGRAKLANPAPQVVSGTKA